MINKNQIKKNEKFLNKLVDIWDYLYWTSEDFIVYSTNNLTIFVFTILAIMLNRKIHVVSNKEKFDNILLLRRHSIIISDDGQALWPIKGHEMVLLFHPSIFEADHLSNYFKILSVSKNTYHSLENFKSGTTKPDFVSIIERKFKLFEKDTIHSDTNFELHITDKNKTVKHTSKNIGYSLNILDYRFGNDKDYLYVDFRFTYFIDSFKYILFNFLKGKELILTPYKKYEVSPLEERVNNKKMFFSDSIFKNLWGDNLKYTYLKSFNRFIRKIKPLRFITKYINFRILHNNIHISLKDELIVFYGNNNALLNDFMDNNYAKISTIMPDKITGNMLLMNRFTDKMKISDCTFKAMSYNKGTLFVDEDFKRLISTDNRLFNDFIETQYTKYSKSKNELHRDVECFAQQLDHNLFKIIGKKEDVFYNNKEGKLISLSYIKAHMNSIPYIKDTFVHMLKDGSVVSVITLDIDACEMFFKVPTLSNINSHISQVKRNLMKKVKDDVFLIHVLVDPSLSEKINRLRDDFEESEIIRLLSSARG